MQKRTTHKFIILALLAMLSTSLFAGQTFKLNLEKGKTYRQNMVSNSNIKQTVNGMSMNINVITTVNTSYTVNNVTKEGADLTMQMEHIKVEVKSDFGSVEMDSKSADANNSAAMVLKKFTEISFPAKINADGTLAEMGNIDTTITRILNETTGLSQMERTQMESQFKQSFGSSTLKNNFQGLTSFYPKNEVKPGDSWETDTETAAVVNMATKNKYTLKEIKGNSAIIEVESTLKTKNPDETTQVNGMPAKTSLDGMTKGTFTLDTKSGWTTSSTLEQTMKGSIEVLDNPMVPGGMKIPMEVTSKITITE